MDGVAPAARQSVGPAEAQAPGGTWGGTMMPVQGPAVLSLEREAFAGYARRLLREPFSRRYLMDRFYASLSFLLAVPCFVFIVLAVILGLSLSFSFAGMLAGVPLLVLSLLAARRLGGVCRGLAARLLGIRVAAPSPPLRPPGIVGWARAGLTNPAAWRACAYLVLKLPVAWPAWSWQASCGCTGSGSGETSCSGSSKAAEFRLWLEKQAINAIASRVIAFLILARQSSPGHRLNVSRHVSRGRRATRTRNSSWP